VERGFASGTTESLEYQVATREVGDSLFFITDLRVCAIARFARLNFIIVTNLGFRSAPPRALRYRRAPRANPNQTADQLDQTSLYFVATLRQAKAHRTSNQLTPNFIDPACSVKLSADFKRAVPRQTEVCATIR
jgi:hypothetical protein